MEPADLSEAEGHRGDSYMQRRKTAQAIFQEISRIEDARASKGSRSFSTSDSGHAESKRKAKRILRTSLADNSQADVPIINVLTGFQRKFRDLVGMRSLREDREQAEKFSALGICASMQLKRAGDVKDVDKAIEYWSVAVALLRNSQIAWHGLLGNIGCAYACRFWRLGGTSDLKNSIKFSAEAVAHTFDGHPNRPAALSNLGNAYRTRFGHLGEPSDLRNAIECQAQAISLAPDGHPDKPTYFSSLGISYRTRFRHLGKLLDLRGAFECQAQAISLTPNGPPNRPEFLNNLGASYMARFERLGELEDLNEAIECQTQGVLLTPDGHPYKSKHLGDLGNLYRARFGRLCEVSDLNRAIKCQAQAVSLIPDGHPDKAGKLSDLGVSYLTRFGRLGELADLNGAIEAKARAVSLTPDGHPGKPRTLSNLGVSYETRFRRLGQPSDLNMAIKFQAQAVSFIPNDHPDKPGMLSNLGASYHVRFEYLGELSDLNAAIECQAKAVFLTPDGHPEKPTCINNLGVSYETRFRRLGELSDQNSAIELQIQSVSLTPIGHSDRPGRLSNIGVSYMTRFTRLGELSDLNIAIECQIQAVSFTPDGHPDKPGMLNNLGNSYMTRFGRLGELLDLRYAIECQAEAVSLTPNGHPSKPLCLNNLGFSYKTRFERLGELSDLNEAIECQAQAVLLTPDGHPGKPVCLVSLGSSYETRFVHLSNFWDLQSAEASFRRASQSFTGAPSIRFYACQKWARLSLHDAMPSPLPAYQQGMSLITQLVWIGTTIGRRYELVAEVSSFATEAASNAIASGAYDLALEWLEAGRSIVWGHIAQLRTPFDDLSRHDSKLAEDLASVGRQLECLGSRLSPLSTLDKSDPGLGQEASAHIQLALEWDRLLKNIRAIPGFEEFLCRPTAGRLLRTPKAHPVVVVNLYGSRCDALILQPDGDTISHVGLPDFSSGEAVSARRYLLSEVRDRRPRPRPNHPEHLQNPLERLWSGVVKPVLDFLGYTRKLPYDQLPRLTWCTSGLLSFFPLHTARSCDESQPGAFDLVISSYTPTLSALLSSQSVDPSSTCGVLAIGQENTPGLTALPCTTKELSIIRKHTLSNPYLQLQDGEATIEQVLDAMGQFSWIHMACHSSQDADDPMRSAFHLHNGDLTLATITKESFTNKGLAFLSACQTAAGDKNMPDEAVHLAAGMLMAGYPSVIGTMWSIADEDGPEVADLVYAELLKDGKMDHRDSARALHRAVSHLRAKVGEKDIARWAPFIHIGS